MEIDVSMFPVLGEPFAVELANTRYERPEIEIDFLADATLIATWFDLVAAPFEARLPARLSGAQIRALRSVRDAMHEILCVATSPHPHPQPPGRALAVLNRSVAAAPYRYRIEWSAGTGPTAGLVPIGGGFKATLAQLAIECGSFTVGADLALVRRCEGPDCPMFFVQRHHKRRFCHEGCAHRARQARYYRSQRSSQGASR